MLSSRPVEAAGRSVGEVEDLQRALELHLDQIERLQRQLRTLCAAVVSTISALVDARDRSINPHSRMVARFAVAIAEELDLSELEIDEVRYAALLHDVGKIGVADSLLNKAGPLTDQEWRAMREHPIVGQRLLDGLPLPSATIAAIRHHHERFDGRGYPDGLSGEAIPIGARIVAVADAFHAMTSDRPYSQRRSASQATAEIVRCAGSHFCPRVAAAFLMAVSRPDFVRAEQAA